MNLTVALVFGLKIPNYNIFSISDNYNYMVLVVRVLSMRVSNLKILLIVSILTFTLTKSSLKVLINLAIKTNFNSYRIEFYIYAIVYKTDERMRKHLFAIL